MSIAFCVVCYTHKKLYFTSFSRSTEHPLALAREERALDLHVDCETEARVAPEFWDPYHGSPDGDLFENFYPDDLPIERQEAADWTDDELRATKGCYVPARKKEG